jgi:prevent-host-death family protein
MTPDREIPQRELRNDVSAVLDEVAAGARLRITVRGKPVADLIPVAGTRTFVPRADVLRILDLAPLDAGFSSDVGALLGQTIDEL